MPLEGYGCTELSPAVAANVPDWQKDNMRQIGNKPGTIGQPLPGVAVRVVHKETMQDLPAGQEGMLLVYGANVMKGYLGRDDLTQKKIIQGGWYITGDLAMLDEDGFITITGREERFAKVGGEMVPLEKVEEEIHAVLKSNDRLCGRDRDSRRQEGRKDHRAASAVGDVERSASLQGTRRTRFAEHLHSQPERLVTRSSELPILGSGKLDLKKCKQMAMDVAQGNGDAA